MVSGKHNVFSSQRCPPHFPLRSETGLLTGMSRCQSLGGCEQHPVCCDPAALNCLLCLRLTEQAGSYGIAPLGYHVFQQPATFSFHHDFQSSQCKFMLARSVLIIIHAPCRVERLAWCCEKYHSPPCVVTCTASPERIFIDFSCNIVRGMRFSQDWQPSDIFPYPYPWKCLFLLPFDHGSKFVLSGTILTTVLVFSLHMLWYC